MSLVTIEHPGDTVSVDAGVSGLAPTAAGRRHDEAARIKKQRSKWW
jgi:hypothetical protein